MVFETKLKCYDTTHERFKGKALMTVRLSQDDIEVIYDCEFCSEKYLYRKAVKWISLEFDEDQDKYRVHISAGEDMYFNFFFLDQKRARHFKNLLLLWTANPNFLKSTDYRAYVSSFKPDE